ncbi:NUDIX domain-containing protein [Demequina lignilytica]|uniref:NUDIX hydrolase n=1 Tax=Demequina lignilytica TaxID=3051663 RepID=A0AAW7M9Y3_9MICO|nr:MULTISPECIES: NUDIX hydrolase [unclassified Demequina]MDN4479091.1 NUDIX hydrolase [Demequina sp. SYSU T00039-1]MDN4484392.1 NUDIX hydrolase [Demequina sp. SYSU T0a273]MDN4488990.1 NUDIX hydrolase [Demequina sp. SYSU T00039]MDN4491299.1 NUDIX hydrolase [Demequina sp. SYSU T00068]
MTSDAHVPLADAAAPRPILAREPRFDGKVWDVVSDQVDLDHTVVTRDFVQHTGAVVIVALNHRDELYLVRQYRHPVGVECWEPPAGLLDGVGETPVEAAARELHEEADLTAETWHVLADYYPSAGGSSEGVRVFLARDLAAVPDEERHERSEEERDMVGDWVALDDILAAIAAGGVHASSLLVGAMAADQARRSGWSTLRPADSPWLLAPEDRRRGGSL